MIKIHDISKWTNVCTYKFNHYFYRFLSKFYDIIVIYSSIWDRVLHFTCWGISMYLMEAEWHICVSEQGQNWTRWSIVAASEPRHYLKQWWKQITAKFESTLNSYQFPFTKCFENVLCKLVAVEPRPQGFDIVRTCTPIYGMEQLNVSMHFYFDFDKYRH